MQHPPRGATAAHRRSRHVDAQQSHRGVEAISRSLLDSDCRVRLRDVVLVPNDGTVLRDRGARRCNRVDALSSSRQNRDGRGIIKLVTHRREERSAVLTQMRRGVDLLLGH
jgi:hypothetical protein